MHTRLIVSNVLKHFLKKGDSIETTLLYFFINARLLLKLLPKVHLPQLMELATPVLYYICRHTNS